MQNAPTIERTPKVMLRPTPIEPGQFSKELQGMLERSNVRLEEIPNFLRILAKAPAAALAYMRIDRTLAAGQLAERQREQIALAVAEINGSNYCLRAHSVIGANTGLSDEEIQSARRASAPDAKTNQILRFTQSVVMQRGDVSDEDLRALRKAGISDAEVVEILANIALNIFTNYLNILSQTEVDFPMVDRAPANASVSAPAQAAA